MKRQHPNRTSRSLHRFAWVLSISCLFFPFCLLADDDVADLLRNARPAATTPATVTSPNARENQPTPNAPSLKAPTPPADARRASVLLNTGITVEGPLWTTTDTPLQIWIEEGKVYRDLELALIMRIDVRVLSESMEDDWRWLKEGSDQKVFSGKKYPNVELVYRFTLLNGQSFEGAVVAPIHVLDSTKTRNLALYKKYKGPLDSTLKDLVYIKSIVLAPPVATATRPTRTTKLPLLPE